MITLQEKPKKQINDGALTFNLVVTAIALICFCFLPLFGVSDSWGSRYSRSVDLSGMIESGYVISFLVFAGLTFLLGLMAKSSKDKGLGVAIIISSLASAVFLIIISNGMLEYLSPEAGITISWISVFLMVISSFMLFNDSPSAPQTVKPASQPSATKPDAVVAQKERFRLKEVEDMTSDKIETILASSKEELNPEYIETLLFVQNDRGEQQSVYQKVAQLSPEQIDEKLANKEMLSKNFILALQYVKRYNECSLEHSMEGFLETFKADYKAPETPLEQAQRQEQERLLAARAKKREADKLKAEKEKLLQEKKSKQNTKIFFVVLLLFVSFFIGQYVVSSRSEEYKTKVNEANVAFNLAIKSIRLNNNPEYLAIDLYEKCLGKSLPFFSSEDEEKYCKSQIEKLQGRIKYNNKQIDAYKERAKSGLLQVGDFYKKGNVKGVVFKANGTKGTIIAGTDSSISFRDASKKYRLPSETEARELLSRKAQFAEEFSLLFNGQTLFYKAFWITKKYKGFGSYDYCIRVSDGDLVSILAMNVYGNIGKTSVIWLQDY